MSAVIFRPFIPRIVREPDAPGWLVILGSYGWLFGSRGEAVHAARELGLLDDEAAAADFSDTTLEIGSSETFNQRLRS